MKENELRIGNLIKISETGTIITVTGIMQNSHGIKVFGITSDGTYCNPWIEYCEPISLTEDWMIRAGFKCKESSSCNLWHIGLNPITHDYLFDLTWLLEPERINAPNAPFYRNVGHTIYYVHQLQNLYFALTGEELTINTDNHDTEGKD